MTNEAALRGLRVLLADPMAPARSAAASALELLLPLSGEEDAVAELAAGLGDAEPRVRAAVEAALLGLVGAGHVAATGAVLACLAHADARVRHRAVGVLGRLAIEDGRALAALQASLGYV